MPDCAPPPCDRWAVAGARSRAEEQMLRDFGGELRLAMPADPGDHHVENRGSAGTGDTLSAAQHRVGRRGARADNAPRKPIKLSQCTATSWPLRRPASASARLPFSIPQSSTPKRAKPLQPPEHAAFAARAWSGSKLASTNTVFAAAAERDVAVHRHPSCRCWLEPARRRPTRSSNRTARLLRQPVGDEQRFRGCGDAEVGEFRQQPETRLYAEVLLERIRHHHDAFQAGGSSECPVAWRPRPRR